jgi:hypothetical protein
MHRMPIQARRLVATTVGPMTASGVAFGASPVFAGDTILWQISPVNTGNKSIILTVQGSRMYKVVWQSQGPRRP